MAESRTLTVGKWRRLHQTAGPKGTFAVVAVDHRGPLRRSLEKESPQGKTNEALTDLTPREIVTLLPLACIVAYFLSHGVWRRAVVVASVVPLALAANIFRVIVTVQLVSSQGVEFAQGLLHESFGVATYVLGTLAVIGVARILR